MAQTISCAYARVAVKELFKKHSHEHRGLMPGTMKKIHSEFSTIFPRFNIDLATAMKRFPTINKVFNKRWHPDNAKESFLTAFSTSNWEDLTESDKENHTLHECNKCMSEHGSLYNFFPSGFKSRNKNTISITIAKNSTPQKAGKHLLETIAPFIEHQTGTSLQEILVNTPQSKLAHRQTSNEKLAHTRRIERQYRSTIQSEYKENDATLVMGNRISWSAYNKIRKAEGLEKRNEKRPAEEEIENTPKRRKHGTTLDTMTLDQEKLLKEARDWPNDKQINWSQLARSYGLQQKNGGQIIKEFLGTKGIAVATERQRTTRKPRRAKKKSSHGVSFPMHAPPSTHKETIKNKIENKEILLGDTIVQQKLTSYRVNKGINTVETVENTVYARQIKLADIRQKMTEDHCKLGLIRDSSDDYFSSLTVEEITEKLKTLSLSTSGSTEEKVDRLKHACRTRHIKVWHDHSEIAGHGHLLVLVAAIYDPAFFYTPSDLEERGVHLDVQSIVEKPYIHILGRSRSTIEEQAQFHQYRFNELNTLNETTIKCKTHTIRDVVRLFHGDGPAQQVEAGAKIGGNYPCIGCKATSSLFSDLAYCFRADSLDVASRQAFVVKGTAWKNGGTKPLDGLNVGELRKELNAHGKRATKQTKRELQPLFEEMRAGINHVPALLQHNPTADINSANLGSYEIIPTEPLHDLKGHLSNLIDETLASENGATKEMIKNVTDTVLSKETLRCSDYRKAIILMYMALRENNPNDTITKVYQTAVEISEILYSHEQHRDTTTILRLHNISFIHGMLCIERFGTPKSMSTRKFFGRYFHSIVCHAPLTYRMISLRSVNTETQERMFQSCKSITRTTSNKHPNHIITNIIERVQQEEELKSFENSMIREESEISKLSKTLPPKVNTTFSKQWIKKCATHYQAHMELISDYLIKGKGIWWDENATTIEFFDTTPPTIPNEPPLSHFRSTNVQDIRFNLFEQWESCLESNIKLPAQTVRCYTSSGDLDTVTDM